MGLAVQAVIDPHAPMVEVAMEQDPVVAIDVLGWGKLIQFAVIQ